MFVVCVDFGTKRVTVHRDTCPHYRGRTTGAQPDNYWHDTAYRTLEVAEVVAGIDCRGMGLHRCETCEPAR